MIIPETYAEWVELLDKLESGTDDSEVSDAMKKGSLSWQSGVAERFTNKLCDVVNGRMNRAIDRFTREMSRAGGEERIIVQALLLLRKELKFLKEVMNIPVIPEKERAEYVRLVTEQADKIQKSLEESSRGDRSGKLSVIVRNNRVNSF